MEGLNSLLKDLSLHVATIILEVARKAAMKAVNEASRHQICTGRHDAHVGRCADCQATTVPMMKEESLDFGPRILAYDLPAVTHGERLAR